MNTLVLLVLTTVASVAPNVGIPFSYRQQVQPELYDQQVYHGRLANLRVIPSGFIQENPEVAYARNLQLAQQSRVGGFCSFRAATPQFIADTPEVSYARNAHLAENARFAYNAYYNIHPQQQRFF